MSSVSDDRTFTEWEHRMVVNVGRKVGYQWNIECDDVISELMLWAHESWKYVTRYRSDKRGKQKLMASLYRKANKYARAEHQAKMIHYQFDKEQTENVYTDRQVETGLVVMFMPSDTKSEYDEDMWSLVADVSGVYASLRSEDKSLLAWKYAKLQGWDEISGRLSTTPDAARMRVRRLVEKIRARASTDKVSRIME